MEKYLRPSTLFNANKFEEYLNQNVSVKPDLGQQSQEFQSWLNQGDVIEHDGVGHERIG